MKTNGSTKSSIGSADYCCGHDVAGACLFAAKAVLRSVHDAAIASNSRKREAREALEKQATLRTRERFAERSRECDHIRALKAEAFLVFLAAHKRGRAALQQPVQ